MTDNNEYDEYEEYEEDEEDDDDDVLPMCFVDIEFRLSYKGLLVLRVTPHPLSIMYNNNYNYRDDDEIAFDFTTDFSEEL